MLREVVVLFNEWGLLHTHSKLLLSWVLRSAVKAGLATEPKPEPQPNPQP